MRRIVIAAIVMVMPIASVLADPPKSARPTYATFVARWHAPVDGGIPDGGHANLTLVSINLGERVELTPLQATGGFTARDLDRAAHVMREPASGSEHPIEPRLLDVVYAIQTHFQTTEIRFISGYRAPKGSSGSNHAKGRALDLVVPGVKDDDTAKFVRTLGFVGCGVYPVSGFLHVDVRDRSYFWLDASGPGKKNRERGILGDVARQSDTAALGRGEKGLPPLTVSTDVDGLLRASAPVPAPSVSTDTTEEDEDIH